MLRFHLITLFPEAVRPYLDASILGRAQGKGGKKKSANGKGKPRPRIEATCYNPRDFSKDKWQRVDRRPYGGGPGMVMEPESVLRAAAKAIGKRKAKVIFFTPAGKQFTQEDAKRLAHEKDIIFLCGRYEGMDARVPAILKAEHYSIGPYVLTGGELPALTMIDAIARHVPGVLGDENSLEESRKSVHRADGVEEEMRASSEVYTRPEVLVWKGKRHRVPKVLLSGDHKAIEEWKRLRKECA